MGSSISKLWPAFSQAYEQIVMLSLDAAGKTTILYQLHLGKPVTVIPTIGFNVETVTFKDLRFTICDVGGGDKIRVLWRHYFSNISTVAIIYVVDSNDRDRLSESRDELMRLLNEDETFPASIVLIFANKQDLPNAIPAIDLIQNFNLFSIRNRMWHVQPCCALTGEGLQQGMEWLAAVYKQQRKKGRGL